MDIDTVPAKQLWDALAHIYTASNAQAILNLRTELDNLRFSDDDGWNEQVKFFAEILGKLATYDAEIPEDDKASKPIRTIPNSFAPLIMSQTIASIDVKRLVTVLRSELAIRKHFEEYKLVPQAPAMAMVSRRTLFLELETVA